VGGGERVFSHLSHCSRALLLDAPVVGAVVLVQRVFVRTHPGHGVVVKLVPARVAVCSVLSDFAGGGGTG
jgi:hypothetical protein